LDTLEALGHTQDTLVIFTSDNGGERWSDMGPLRGRKGHLWEGGIRVPAFVRWPGVISADSSTDQVVTTLDWYATMLAAAGLPLPAELDGMDMLPHLKGEAPLQERTVFWRCYQRRRHKAVRSGNWKYLMIEPLEETDQDVAGEYLFDLAADPSEEHDLKEGEREVFERLKALYADWEADVLEPIPLPNQ
jgi:arylsulfatase A-like enzyme